MTSMYFNPAGFDVAPDAANRSPTDLHDVGRYRLAWTAVESFCHSPATAQRDPHPIRKTTPAGAATPSRGLGNQLTEGANRHGHNPLTRP
jgi:hypothetical protein